jgi:hypothetical protein
MTLRRKIAAHPMDPELATIADAKALLEAQISSLREEQKVAK